MSIAYIYPILHVTDKDMQKGEMYGYMDTCSAGMALSALWTSRFVGPSASPAQVPVSAAAKRLPSPARAP